jgi:hypothetical protein
MRSIPLSHSSVQKFLVCHQLYYLTAIRGIQIKDSSMSDAAKMGALWDTVLSVHLDPTLIDRSTFKPISITDTINRYQINSRSIAKVKAIYRAYKALEIKVEPDYELQAKVDITLPVDNTSTIKTNIRVTGFYDRLYTSTHMFAENKLSGSPDRYLDPWFIQSQVGTYFLADPNLQSCIMEVIRTPQLKSTRSNKEEDDDTFMERCYQDIISRPSFYFLGYDSTRRTYGKRFYRSEFNLSDIQSRYVSICREIEIARLSGGWYKNDAMCKAGIYGGPCDMLPICQHDAMSEENFHIREKDFKF